MGKDAETSTIVAIRAERNFLGHPRGVGTLSFMTMFNALANYSMSAVLIYYLYATVSEGGLGFDQTQASQLVSLYWAVQGLVGLLGSYVADRILGPRAAVRIAKGLGALGYVFLAIHPLGVAGYAISQVLLLCSAMMQGRAQDALLGMFYDRGDSRREGAFAIGYVINNVGAVVPVFAGTIALIWGYQAAFAVAAASALAGWMTYLLTERKFFGSIGIEADDPLSPSRRSIFIARLAAIVIALGAILGFLLIWGVISITQFANFGSSISVVIPCMYFIYIVRCKKVTHGESLAVLSLLPMFVANCFTQLVWNQGTTILAIYAETTVDRSLFGMEFTPAAFQSVSAVCAVVFGSIAALLWTRLGDRQPKPHAKFGIGTVIWGIGPVFMCLPFAMFAPGVKVSPLWLVMFFVIVTAGEAITNATGFSTASRVAPRAFVSQMITVYGLSQSAGAGLTTLAVNFYQPGSEIPYFLFVGGITAVIGMLLIVFSGRFSALMGLDAQRDG
ncbi:amino acid/peptide transporter [Coriobacterium glomerans PW2]|uniref:Amino acid/peptide transporter n=1 Tax=Coriobacterium glomerans (strain ATCC 49209 / DSM 20642 / JCM 10262 / PW2) TaxID=700015 RepID=F2N9X3_CORGP|nr:oligopeptide:H+ symporter [Coriobacterium glomerans]AEB06228.1 amino acid/peptide transporter [Coriobacterium glomerans PW2]